MLPLKTDAPRGPGRPALVLAIVGACVAVFLVQQSLPRNEAFGLLVRFALIPRRYDDPLWAIRNGLDPNDWLPLISMAFLHGGWLHLIFNMWTLWLFGRSVEARLGHLRFAVLYGACALLASAAQLWVNAGSPIPTIGASGAIAGVLGAHVMLYPRSRVVLVIPIWIIPFFLRVSAFWYVAIWFGLQVLQGTGALMTPQTGGVAWWAHIGGFLAGLAFVGFLAPPAPPAPPPRRADLDWGEPEPEPERGARRPGPWG
jgi:membrane associated rhomboid family serine protease